MEREEATDDGHEQHAAAHARHHGDHADREARGEERREPDPPCVRHFWRYANPMPRFAANVSTLFTEVAFLERFAAARRAGFRAVEYQYPYDFPPAEVARAAREAGVEVVLHNMPQGDAQRNERGTACLPGREPRFRDDLERAIEYARAARCKSLH